MDATQPVGSWADILLKGASALIDSQAQKQFLSNQAKYNTANGTAGQSQFTSLASSPALLLIGGAVVVLVVVLALRR